jgi:murein DD-endopeptidase MepM/ murein hydrolase activator NlpD
VTSQDRQYHTKILHRAKSWARYLAFAGFFVGVLFVANRVERAVEWRDWLLWDRSARAAIPSAIVTDMPANLRREEIAALPPVIHALPETDERRIAVKRGDTLMDILLSAGISRAEAHSAISVLSSIFDPRGLRPGHEITVTLTPGENSKLLGASIVTRADRDIGLTRDASGRYTAFEREKELTHEYVRVAGTISVSLYEAAMSAGVPPTLLAEMIRAFSFDIDFQREIQPGDGFELLFDHFRTNDGKIARLGSLHYATLVLSNKPMTIFRHVPADGFPDYFNDKGESVRKALLKTPIDGARLTSGFGTRMHPILGYSAMHKGVDFGAATGTPIQAAGDGTVEQASWSGAYGNYVRIRHNGEYATAYAHLSRYGAGIKEGARVRQGQIIGYVGSTGRSTGPHLHYEILRRGAQVNPMGVKFPSGKKLEGIDLVKFNVARGETVRRLDATLVSSPPPKPATVATAPGDSTQR